MTRNFKISRNFLAVQQENFCFYPTDREEEKKVSNPHVIHFYLFLMYLKKIVARWIFLSSNKKLKHK